MCRLLEASRKCVHNDAHNTFLNGKLFSLMFVVCLLLCSPANRNVHVYFYYPTGNRKTLVSSGSSLVQPFIVSLELFITISMKCQWSCRNTCLNPNETSYSSISFIEPSSFPFYSVGAAVSTKNR